MKTLESCDSGSNSNFNSNSYSQEQLIARLHRVLGPLAGGMILDAADLVTIGPVGVFAGMIVGCTVGWWVSSIYQESKKSRLIWSALAGVYCTIPFTAIVPLATIISAIGQFRIADTCTNTDKAGIRSGERDNDV